MTEKKTHQLTDKEKQLDLYIDLARQQLETDNKMFDFMDTKTQRFLVFVSAIEGYIGISFFYSKVINLYTTKDLILILVLLTGIILIGMYFYILKGKPFFSGVNIKKTKEMFYENKTFHELKEKISDSLVKDCDNNYKTICEKGKIFNDSINILILYGTLIIIYFIISLK